MIHRKRCQMGVQVARNRVLRGSSTPTDQGEEIRILGRCHNEFVAALHAGKPVAKDLKHLGGFEAKIGLDRRHAVRSLTSFALPSNKTAPLNATIQSKNHSVLTSGLPRRTNCGINTSEPHVSARYAMYPSVLVIATKNTPRLRNQYRFAIYTRVAHGQQRYQQVLESVDEQRLSTTVGPSQQPGENAALLKEGHFLYAATSSTTVQRFLRV